MWASFSSLFTPTVLFCVVNFTIVTIFITSSLKPQKNRHQLGDDSPTQLVRVPSLFDRVRSFNLSIYRSDQPDPFPCTDQPQEEQACFHQNIETTEKSMAKTASIQHSLKQKIQNPAQYMTKTASIEHNVNQTIQNPEKSTEEKVRIKHDVKQAENIMEESQVTRTKSDMFVAEKVVAEKKKGKKMGALRGGDEAVDDKAEDFISRFRQQLKLQRIESLVRYKEMLSRGTSI